MSFEFDESKIPEVKMSKSILTSFDEHYVEYNIDGITFVDPQHTGKEYAEKMMYAWAAWLKKLSK